MKFQSISEIEAYLYGHSKVECLYCKGKYKNLALHLNQAHDTDARTYREEFGIPEKYGLVCSSTKQKNSEHILGKIAAGEWEHFDQARINAHNTLKDRYGDKKPWAQKKLDAKPALKKLRQAIIKVAHDSENYVYNAPMEVLLKDDTFSCSKCGANVVRAHINKKLNRTKLTCDKCRLEGMRRWRIAQKSEAVS